MDEDATAATPARGHDNQHRPTASALNTLAFIDELEGFARRTLAAATLDQSSLDTLALATDLTRWAWHAGQLPLDTNLLYDPPVLEYYLQTACRHMTRNQLERRRTILLHIRTRLSTTPVTPPTPQERPPTTPYTAADVLGILSWARIQPTPERRASAHALIALGFGAGLTAQEIITTRARDISRNSGGADIAVGPPHPRVVPVLHQLVDTLPSLAHLHENDFVFRPQRAVEHRNSISDFAQRGPERRLHPITSRMRATWLVHQLTRAAPLSVLAAAAGMNEPAKLLPYARFLPSATNNETDPLHSDGRSLLR